MKVFLAGASLGLASLLGAATALAQAAGQTAGRRTTASPSSADAISGALWAAAVVAAVGVLVVVWLVARKYAQKDDRGSASMPFTLDELCRLRADGTLSAEEFERAKSVIVSRALNAKKAEEARKGNRVGKAE